MKYILNIFLLLILILFNCERKPIFNYLSPISNTENYPILNNNSFWWIKKVIEYKPAWGSYVNNSYFNDIKKVYGPPSGGGTETPDNSSILTLGSGGGYIIVQFSPPITNDAKNIKGYDFIIFGNAFWINNNSTTPWKEPAIVEVMKDENKNGIPDDTWYLLKGNLTEITDLITLSYSRIDTNIKPINKTLYPQLEFFPLYPDNITFTFFEIKTNEIKNLLYGYADCTPTLKLGDTNADNIVDNPDIKAEDFYTIPDDPNTPEIDHNSGGGDAFKLEWAVDESTGVPVILDSIDFIKITSAATETGVYGEYSTEIDAISRVKKSNE